MSSDDIIYWYLPDMQRNPSIYFCIRLSDSCSEISYKIKRAKQRAILQIWFRRFLAALVFPILWLSELTNYLELWCFCLKWGLNEVHTTSRSWDMILADSGGFWRCLAVLVLYVFLLLSELTNYLEMLPFCLKWGLNEVHTTSGSRDINSAVFRRFSAVLEKTPPPQPDHHPGSCSGP